MKNYRKVALILTLGIPFVFLVFWMDQLPQTWVIKAALTSLTLLFITSIGIIITRD